MPHTVAFDTKGKSMQCFLETLCILLVQPDYAPILRMNLEYVEMELL